MFCEFLNSRLMMLDVMYRAMVGRSMIDLRWWIKRSDVGCKWQSDREIREMNGTREMLGDAVVSRLASAGSGSLMHGRSVC